MRGIGLSALAVETVPRANAKTAMKRTTACLRFSVVFIMPVFLMYAFIDRYSVRMSCTDGLAF
jgi:hypothetical protein